MYNRALTGLALIFATAGTVQAQTPRDGLLISPDRLAALMEQGDVVLLHVGDTAGYRQAHLPGAHFVQLSDISAPRTGGDLSLQLPTADALKATLESYGVSDGSHIVVYWGQDWVTPSTRVVFTLDWAGLGERTHLLDGGMPAWQAAGRLVTTKVPAAGGGRITRLEPRPDRVVQKTWLESNLNARGFALVDARAPVFYEGTRPDNGRLGHIPHAGSLPWADLVVDGDVIRWKSADELKALFAAAGVAPGETVIVYCHIGQFATSVAFAARTLGYDVRLFDGSFQEWSRDPAAPLETKKAGGS